MDDVEPSPGSSVKHNEFIAWIEFYLRIAAIKPNSGLVDIPRVLYHVIVMALACVSGWVLFYQRYDDFSINTDVLLHAVVVGHSLFVYLVYLRGRDRLCLVARTMEDRFSHLSQSLQLHRHHNVWNAADRHSLKLMKLGSYSCVTLYFFYIINANLFSPQRKLPYPLWIPFSLESPLPYYLTVGLQVSVFSLYSFIHVSGCGMCIGGAHFIGASFDVLGLSFRDLCGLEFRKHTGSTLKISQVFAEEQLKKCVEIHVALLSLIKVYKSVFETILLEVLLSCEVIICFAGFQVVLAAEKKDPQKAALLFMMVLLLVFHLFMFCYPGQHIYNKSEQWRESLYFSRWENQTLKFQKCFNFMLLSSLKPVTLSFRGVTDASMVSFQHALRTAFSYINILLILRKAH